MKFSRQKTEEVSVNLTPLIDVVFLLLIFFMVSTTFKQESRIEIDLPQSGAAQGEAPDEVLELVISSEGRYQLNGERLDAAGVDALAAALRRYRAPDADAAPLIISADASTPHQAVVTAMDAAGASGFTRLSITTRKSDP